MAFIPDPVIKSQQAMCWYVSNPLLIGEFKLRMCRLDISSQKWVALGLRTANFTHTGSKPVFGGLNNYRLA
jgi:hypothetical protein